MLSNVIKYSGLYAKIKALETNLLTYDDFYSLAKQKDVPSFANKLSESVAYSSILKELLNYNMGTRMPLEKNLVKSLYKDFSSVYSFLTDIKEKKYLNTLFLKYEIYILKTLIRSIFDERDLESSLPTYDDYILKHLTINIDKLKSSKTTEDFVNNLIGTKYYILLQKINLKDNSLFEFELSLDLFYYLQTWKYQNKYLSKRNQSFLRCINGSDIDLNNIMHIYRYKKFYEVDKSIIYTYLLPINYKLKKSQIDSLIDAKSDFEFKEVLNNTYYKNVFTHLQTGQLETDYYMYMLNLYNKEERKNPFSIVPAVSYFYKKTQEISNLTTLIEYIRYERDPENSMQRLNIVSKKAVI